MSADSRFHRTKIRFGAFGIAACLVLCGCAVGPAYHKPAAPDAKGYTSAPQPATIGAVPTANGAGRAQHLHIGAAPEHDWWKSFGSPQLNRTVADALTKNPGIRQAEETLNAARYNYRAANGAFYPQIGIGVGGQHTRSSGAGPVHTTPSVYSLYTAQVQVSYTPDIFGLNRLVSRAEQAQVDLADDQLQAVRLTLTGNVIDTAIDLAALNDALDATRQSLADEQKIYQLVKLRYEHGAVSQQVLDAQQTQLSDVAARLPVLEQQRDADLNLLAVYTGRFPAQGPDGNLPALSAITLPADLPVSLPTALVRARPDIRAAEAQLRAANAQVGVAVARMYPQFSLTGDVGHEANQWGTLFDPANKIWNLAANLVLPVFEGGTLEAEKHAAEAEYRGIFAQYQMTVLDAFRQVADVLSALNHDAQALDARVAQTNAARQSFELARAQYRAGAIDYLDLLNSEVSYQNARIALVQARQQRYADTVALYVAMGGGAWVHAPDAAPATPPITEQK
jgi:NodT family efflux transporter outer membrane factor (OMF) lipoprotein